MITHFNQLACWKACREIVRITSSTCKSLPPHEKFELAQNMIRAARSSTRNIAEGYGRFYFKENIQFCRISRGSLFELIDDYITCQEEKYISKEAFDATHKRILHAIKILNGYIKYLKNRSSSQ
jgi:four helix bundle protein